MSIGVYIKNGNRIGGEFSVTPEHLPVATVLRRNESVASGIIGIDPENIRHEYFVTPETDHRKLDKIIQLQEEYQQAALKSQDEQLHYLIRKSSDKTEILFLIMPRVEANDAIGVYPAFTALYAAAWEKNLIKSNQNTMILFIMGDRIMGLMTEGEDIVFVRSFAAGGDLALNLKLTAQNVLWNKQRSFLKLDHIVVISNNHEDAGRIASAANNGPKVSHIDVSGYFSDLKLNDQDRGDLILAYELSRVPQIKTLDSWNVKRPTTPNNPKKIRIALRCLVMLLAAIPLFMLAEALSDQIVIAGINKQLADLAPAYQKTADIMESVGLMKNFAANNGRDMIGPDICFSLLQELDKSRSDEIYFSSVVGNPYNTIAVNGCAGNYASMLKLINNLVASSVVAEYELIYANRNDSGSIEFQLLIKYKFAKEFMAAQSTGNGTATEK